MTVNIFLAVQTINDVLFGVISSGISRYLDHRKPNGKSGVTLSCFSTSISDIGSP